ELDTNRIEAIFRKGMNPEIDSYSGIYDNGNLKSTGLSAYLKAKCKKQVYLVVLAGDFCVYYSAKDALKENFDTYFIKDATRAINEAGFESAIKDIQANNGKVILSSEIK